MSKIVKVSQNNYRLKVQSGGTITLDTGVYVGTVVITGDLTVLGNTTTVDTANMTIEDNIILLNKGETGTNGVTEGTSGIEIDRGPSYPNSRWILDDTKTWYDPLTLSEVKGPWTARDANNKTGGIRVASIANDGTTDLVFDLQDSLNFKENVLSIVNIDPDHYAQLVFGDTPIPNITPSLTPAQDNDIPNKRFVSLYVQSGVFTPGMADVDKIYKTVGGTEKTRVQAYTTTVDVLVNQSLRSRYSANGLDVDHINIFNNTVKNTGTSNLILSSAVNIDSNNSLNKNVQVDGVLWLNDQLDQEGVTGIATVSGTTKLYSRSHLSNIDETPGRTGVFFKNTTSEDELVSKNRALLFSMLF